MLRRQFFELRPGETVEIGAARVTLEQKSGQRARLRVESDQPTRHVKERAPELQRAAPAPTSPPLAGVAALRPPKPG